MERCDLPSYSIFETLLRKASTLSRAQSNHILPDGVGFRELWWQQDKEEKIEAANS